MTKIIFAYYLWVIEAVRNRFKINNNKYWFGINNTKDTHIKTNIVCVSKKLWCFVREELNNGICNRCKRGVSAETLLSTNDIIRHLVFFVRRYDERRFNWMDVRWGRIFSYINYEQGSLIEETEIFTTIHIDELVTFLLKSPRVLYVKREDWRWQQLFEGYVIKEK